MDYVPIVSAAIAFGSLIVAVLNLRSSNKRKLTEQSKMERMGERLRGIQAAALGSLHNADAIVQESKQDGVTVRELAGQIRRLRAQLHALVEQLEDEKDRAVSWRFGEYLPSYDERKPPSLTRSDEPEPPALPPPNSNSTQEEE